MSLFFSSKNKNKTRICKLRTRQPIISHVEITRTFSTVASGTKAHALWRFMALRREIVSFVHHFTHVLLFTSLPGSTLLEQHQSSKMLDHSHNISKP
jgi:hypothetical protein